MLTLRPHGDAFVELLRDAHRPRRGEAEPAGRLLLQRAGDEGRRGAAVHLPLRYGGDAVGRAVEVAQNRVGGRLVRQRNLVRLAGPAVQRRGERRARARQQVRLDGPVLDGDEGVDLGVALRDEAEGDRLHAPCGEGGARFDVHGLQFVAADEAVEFLPDERPEEGTQFEADEAVFDAARLLRVHEFHINGALVLERFLDGFLRDGVEDDAADGLAAPARRLDDVPRDRLALAVGVGRQVDGVGLLAGGLDLADDFALVLQRFVPRREVALGVHAEFVGREVAHVPH